MMTLLGEVQFAIRAEKITGRRTSSSPKPAMIIVPALQSLNLAVEKQHPLHGPFDIGFDGRELTSLFRFYWRKWIQVDS